MPGTLSLAVCLMTAITEHLVGLVSLENPRQLEEMNPLFFMKRERERERERERKITRMLPTYFHVSCIQRMFARFSITLDVCMTPNTGA